MNARLRSTLFFLWHLARNDGVNRAFKELEQNQWLSKADLAVLQQRKLAALLSFAANNVPYYRSLLRDLGNRSGPTLADEYFLSIPPLTKQIIRREKEAMVSENLSGNGLRDNSTSGSSGEALRFYTDLRSLPYRQAAAMRSDGWTGWRLGDRVVRLWGAAIDEKRTTRLRGKLHGWVSGNRLLSSFDLSAGRMNEYIRTIQTFKPSLLVGYPGPLEEFAQHCLERGVHLPSLRAIVSSAETLWPHQREIVETAFGIKVFNRYGCREVGQICSECEFHDGLHISADRVLVEVVDDEDRPCGLGEAGRILVTDLDNFGMPLIRYDIGDRGAISGNSGCKCGRGLPLLENIEGRTMEIVRTPDGRRIGGTFWTLLLKRRPGLRQIQIIQRRLDGIIINFVRDSDFDYSVLAYFTTRIRDYCGSDFDVKFVEKDRIALTGSGKQMLIISELEHARNTFQR